jgi:hypothetical protein
MRVRELALAGAFALSAAIPVHADPPGSKMRTAGPIPGITQGGSGSDWHPGPGQMSQWSRGWVPLLRGNQDAKGAAIRMRM